MSHIKSYKRPTSIAEAYTNHRYRGKIVIESPEGLFSTYSEERAVKVYRRLERKYPDQPPVLTTIPKGVMVSLPVK